MRKNKSKIGVPQTNRPGGNMARMTFDRFQARALALCPDAHDFEESAGTPAGVLVTQYRFTANLCGGRHVVRLTYRGGSDNCHIDTLPRSVEAGRLERLPAEEAMTEFARAVAAQRQ